MIGTEAVSRAAPDGTTLLMTMNTYLIDAQVEGELPSGDQLRALCFLVESPAVLVVQQPRRLSRRRSPGRGACSPNRLTMASVGPERPFKIGLRDLHAHDGDHDLRALCRQRACGERGAGRARDLGVRGLCRGGAST